MKQTHAGRRDPDLWNKMVNSLFDGKQPVLSAEESLAAAKKLYRHATGKAWPGKWEVTSGNRYTWARHGIFSVNPDKREAHTRGLRSLIHDISHYAHSRLHPQDSAHSLRQVRLEARLVKFALQRKWHEGALKRSEPPAPVEAPKPDIVKQRYARMVRRRDKYAAELERAKRLLAKARREVAEYERRHGSRLA